MNALWLFIFAIPGYLLGSLILMVRHHRLVGRWWFQ